MDGGTKKVVVPPRAATGKGAPAKRATDPVTVVIFGASGDLARRKLVPALYQLQKGGFLPDKYAVIGFARTEMSDAAYSDAMGKALQEAVPKEELSGDVPLLKVLRYQAGNNDDVESFKKLKTKLEAVERELGLPGNRLFYLSVAPEFFGTIIENLKAAGLVSPQGGDTWSRVIIEKPFGRDLKSARALNAEVTSALHENQIYRIDHYLGKETVQNILTFRFGNSIFEPLFNQKYVDNVQISVVETLGMEHKRGAYYDTAGALRDMVQNHILQLLCLITMEPPSAMEAQAIRDEKVKVLRAIEPLNKKLVAARTVRGQYGVGELEGQVIKGYRQEEGVNPKSFTETFVGLKLNIDNWRWAGVPFFIRTGKRLPKRASEIAVVFKQPPLHLFRELVDINGESPRPQSNVIVMRIQPDEGISLTFGCKEPGMAVRIQEVQMDFFYGRAFQARSPEAYERLLLDALRGDASLFTRSDENDYAWRLITSIHEGWAELPPPTFPNYYPFSEGPEELHRLVDGTSAELRPLASM
jgi:glucose-6-phosphate 1-dehydrogenase